MAIRTKTIRKKINQALLIRDFLSNAHRQNAKTGYTFTGKSLFLDIKAKYPTLDISYGAITGFASKALTSKNLRRAQKASVTKDDWKRFGQEPSNEVLVYRTKEIFHLDKAELNLILSHQTQLNQVFATGETGEQIPVNEIPVVNEDKNLPAIIPKKRSYEVLIETLIDATNGLMDPQIVLRGFSRKELRDELNRRDEEEGIL